MALFVKSDGSAVERLMAMRRRHGESLSEKQVRRINDILYRLLTVMFGLSPADARRCMGRTITDSLIRTRQRKLAPIAEQIGEFALITEVIRDAG